MKGTKRVALLHCGYLIVFRCAAPSWERVRLFAPSSLPLVAWKLEAVSWARRGPGSSVGRANTADGADWWTLKCLVFVPCSFSKVSCDHHTMGPPITHTKLAHLCRQCGKRLN